MILTPDGYAQAIRREEDRRTRAWLAVPLELGKGVVLAPYTMRRHLILLAARNPMASGRGEPDLAELLQFLWVCSVGFAPRGRPLWRLRRWLFLRRAVKLPATETLRRLRDYIDDAFADAPVPLNKPAFRRAPKTSAVSQYLVRLRPLTGWTMEDILDRPIGQVWQVLRAADLSEDGKVTYDDESERIKLGYVAARNEAAQAARVGADKPAQN